MKVVCAACDEPFDIDPEVAGRVISASDQFRHDEPCPKWEGQHKYMTVLTIERVELPDDGTQTPVTLARFGGTFQGESLPAIVPTIWNDMLLKWEQFVKVAAYAEAGLGGDEDSDTNNTTEGE